MHNTPSTQRTPGPVSSPVAPKAGPRARGGEERVSTLELDGRHDGEEQHVESWLHLSLGFETG